MATAAAFIKVEGIPADATVGWAGGTLYLPLTAASHLIGGYPVPVAGKVGNSAEQDLEVNLVTYPLVVDHSAGMGKREFALDARRYWMPAPTGTGTTLSDGPLAWTLKPDVPLLCGAGWTAQNPPRTFLQFSQFIAELYGIDTKTGRVLKERSGTWEYYTGLAWTSTDASGTITGAANNGAGLVRITDVAHGRSTGQVVSITGVTGTTEANGVWTITVISADTFDLQGSTFANAYVSGGTWKLDAAGLRATPTSLFTRGYGTGRQMLIGQGTGDDTTIYARVTTDGQAYSNFTQKGAAQNAQQFCTTGRILWFSTGNTVYENVGAGKQARYQRFGDPKTDILGIVGIYEGIFVIKAEGAFFWHVNQDYVEDVAMFNGRSGLNGRVCESFNDMVWFSAERTLYAWDGDALRDYRFVSWEGNKKKPFYSGIMVGGYSDGRRLYFVMRVQTEDATPVRQYYLMVYTGATGGFHPVFYAGTTTNPSAPETGGVILFGEKLYYSFARNGSQEDRIGYLNTDGEVPMATGSMSFAEDTAILTGWWDGDRPVHKKVLREIRLNVVDLSDSNNKGKVKVYYRKRADASFTLLGETAAGTSDFQTLTFPQENSAANGVIGVRFQFKFVLTNVDASPDSAWYLQDAYLIGRVYNKPAYNLAFSVPLVSQDLNSVESDLRDDYDSVVLLAGLRAATRYEGVVRLTHPDGNGYDGFLRITGNGEQIEQFDEEGRIGARRLACEFVEAA